MIVYLIRHAQSENNLLGEVVRQEFGDFSEEAYTAYVQRRVAEPSLTQTGFEQARMLGEHLRLAAPKHKAGMDDPGDAEPGEFHNNPYGITRLYTSPMLRTLQTTRPVADALGLAPTVWTEIFEHGGVFDNSGPDYSEVVKHGLTRQEMAAAYPDYQLPPGVTEQGWWFGNGEEDLAGCQARAIRVAERLWQLAEEEPDERIALVSHGTFLSNLLTALLGGLPGRHFYFGLYNTSITRLDFTTDRRTGAPFLVLRYVNRVDHLVADIVT